MLGGELLERSTSRDLAPSSRLDFGSRLEQDGESRAQAVEDPWNFHSRRHMGQCGCGLCELTHLRMQWRWKAWLHAPHTAAGLFIYFV